MSIAYGSGTIVILTSGVAIGENFMGTTLAVGASF
ncbi:hypothetical protein AZE42_05635 [Rhizopogon vesiculosus]|uniref:Uncharacterized protein n=1 Tax=Rhizopogon vesiculosus TaxID=180088 RepID=A0A1J8QJA6_9AGAM|nr:hypothetical protein AZE42_05635 [Rhizopogon vesiculosus]